MSSRHPCNFSESKCAQTLLMRISGHADYLHCKPLKKFLDWNAHPTATTRIVIEFSQCKSMDSTVLGLLAQAAIRMMKNGTPALTLANLHGSPRASAVQLGLSHLTLFVDAPELILKNQHDAPAIALASVDSESIRDAHLALVEAQPSNRDLFSDFLNFTTSELTP